MRITIDTEARTLTEEDGQSTKVVDLYSPEGFERLSHLWLKVGWNEKYTYTFSWMGRPVIQLPDDMLRIQEVIWRVQPDVIIETGVAHGGSLVYYASICKAMQRGRIIGVDIEIRPHNRRAIEQHILSPLITLIEGNSVSKETLAKVKNLIKPEERVLVLLDSCHTRQHVATELEAFAPLVSPGSYIVATDGFMQYLTDVPRGEAQWTEDNPSQAARDFVAKHPEFILEQPPWSFNESDLSRNVTHWPDAWLRRQG